MAEGKKGFLLYADYQELFEELSDEDAGQLIKHIFKYVNDKDPETKNQLVKISFIPIKRQLKRDLEKYEGTKVIRSKAGKASAAARKLKKEQELTGDNSVQHNPTKSTHVKSVQHNSTKSTDSVNENVNDNVIDSVINEKINPSLIAFRNNVFKEAREQGMKDEVAKSFYEYWSAMHYESGKYLYQYTENFTLHNKLKGWQGIEDKKEKEKPQTQDYKEL